MGRAADQKGHSVSSQGTLIDPFDNAYFTSPPTKPSPVALPPTHIKGLSHDETRSWIDRDISPDPSISEKRDSVNTMDEKQWQKAHNHKRQQSHIHSRQQSYDIEKAAYTSPRSSRRLFMQPDNLSLALSDRSTTNAQTPQSQHTLRILLFLSGPCMALSFLGMIWTVLALFVAILYQPVRLCTSRLSFGRQLCHFLAPVLSLQLRCIYSPPLPRPTDEDDTYSAGGLVLVQFVAPLLALGIAVSAWIVGLYWALARVVGDPSGQDKRDDGVEAVLGLRNWWERFLLNGVRRS